MSEKKIVRVEGGTTGASEPRTFTPADENRGKAKMLRVYAIILWILGIGCEVGAILVLRTVPINSVWLIALIAGDLVLVIIGSLLWKRSNRLDPASEKEPVKFFIQNQLGTIISVIAFLPLVLLIFTNKNMDSKQKGIIGGIAVVALLIAGVTSYDFNPPSVEKYSSQVQELTALTGSNFVYWTQSGTHYHLYKDCSYINTDRTAQIYEGTVQQAKELKNITDLCSRCKSRMQKQKGITPTDVNAKEAAETEQ